MRGLRANIENLACEVARQFGLGVASTGSLSYLNLHKLTNPLQADSTEWALCVLIFHFVFTAHFHISSRVSNVTHSRCEFCCRIDNPWPLDLGPVTPCLAKRVSQARPGPPTIRGPFYRPWHDRRGREGSWSKARIWSPGNMAWLSMLVDWSKSNFLRVACGPYCDRGVAGAR